MKYVIIGGAGAMGQIAVRDLVEFADKSDEIVVADYDFEKAKSKVAAFGNRVSAIQINVTDLIKAKKALEGTFVVINCVQYHLNIDVMRAALAVKAHYIDLGGLFHMTRKQLELNEDFKAANRIAILGMGAAPGITNILSRMAVDQLDSVQEIHTRVAGSDQSKYKDVPALPLSYSLQTILEEFSMPPAVFTKGAFIFAEPMSGMVPLKFPPPLGVKKPMFTIHSEVATLPLTFAAKGVKEVSFKIAFDTEFLDRVRFLRDLGLASHELVKIGHASVAPIELVNKIAMAQKQAKLVGKLNQHEIVRAIVKGTIKKKKVTLILDCHTKGLPKWGFGTDVNTGCPPAVAALMLAKGEITGIGTLAPEVAVPPDAFFKHLKKRQFWVTQTKKTGWGLKT